MEPVAVIMGLAFTAANTLIVLLCVPLVLGKIPRNTFYGVRLPTTLKSDAAWYVINHHAGVRMIVAGMIGIVLGVTMLNASLKLNLGYAIVLGCAQMLLWLLPTVPTLLFVRRFKKDQAGAECAAMSAERPARSV